MPDTTSLSPAEALLLLKPNRTPSTRTLRVTLLSLLVKGILRIEERIEPGFFRNRKVPHLLVVPAQTPAAPPHVAAVINVVRGAQFAGGRIRDVVQRAQDEFGTGCGGYNSRLIIPSLVERGLLEARRVLFVRTWRATPAGEAERRRIEADIDRARQLPRLLKSDPAEAAALALALGGTLLLVDDLRRHSRQLADAMRSSAADGGPVGDFGGMSSSGDVSDGFDLGCFDAGSFDAFDACIDLFDSGFSDAGGDGGGDGGDGGGGGGH